MESLSEHKLFEKWLELENKKLNRMTVNAKEEAQAKRTYIHFDKRRRASSLILMKNEMLDVKRVSEISWWPFLKVVIRVPSYKKRLKTKRREDKLKERMVYYSAHKDALVYSWYSFLLNEKYYTKKLKELGIENCASAYRKISVNNYSRKNKCNTHFAKEVFEYVKKFGECAVIISDISQFFDSLDHNHLKKEWCSVLGIEEDCKLTDDHFAIYKQMTEFKYVDKDEVFKRFNIKNKKIFDKTTKKKHNVPVRDGNKIEEICSRKEFVKVVAKGGLIKGNENRNKISGSSRIGSRCGIMQGSPISATLSNVYMISFDKEMDNLIKEREGLYRRYSDDIAIVCKIEDCEFFKGKLFSNIKKYELIINPDKTKATYFLNDKDGELRGFNSVIKDNRTYKNLQYLGFEFDGQRTFIRSSSLAKYYGRMKSKIKKSVRMAYGRHSKTKEKDNKVFKKTLYKKYLYKGRRSFISYALRAYKIMESPSIRKQLAGRFKIIKKSLDDKISKRNEKK